MRKKQVIIPFTLILIFFIMNSSNQALSDKTVRENNRSELIVLRGKVSIKGNEPVTYLCLSSESGSEYKLTGKLQTIIRNRHQQQIIVVKGKIVKKAVGPGFPAEFDVSEILDIHLPDIDD